MVKFDNKLLQNLLIVITIIVVVSIATLFISNIAFNLIINDISKIKENELTIDSKNLSKDFSIKLYYYSYFLIKRNIDPFIEKYKNLIKEIEITTAENKTIFTFKNDVVISKNSELNIPIIFDSQDKIPLGNFTVKYGFDYFENIFNNAKQLLIFIFIIFILIENILIFFLIFKKYNLSKNNGFYGSFDPNVYDSQYRLRNAIPEYRNLFHLGLKYFHDKNYKKSYDIFNKIYIMNPENIKNLKLLGLLAYYLHDYVSSNSWYKKVLEINNEDKESISSIRKLKKFI